MRTIPFRLTRLPRSALPVPRLWFGRSVLLGYLCHGRTYRRAQGVTGERRAGRYHYDVGLRARDIRDIDACRSYAVATCTRDMTGRR